MNLNKPLPPLPRPDDVAEDLNVVSLPGEEPPDLPPYIENLNGFLLTSKEPQTAPTKSIFPLPKTKRQHNFVENPNVRSVAGKKKSDLEKKLPDVPVSYDSHYTTFKFVGGFDPRLRLTPNLAEDDGYRHPLALCQSIVNQNTRLAAPTLAEVTAMYSIQIETPIPVPVPEDIPTKLVFSTPTVIPSPDQHHDPVSIRPPETATTPPTSAVTDPAEPALNVISSRRNVTSFPPCLPLPFPGYNKIQCSGITRAERQCRREPRLPPTYLHLDPVPKFYCYQHKSAIFDHHCFYPNGLKTEDQEKSVEFNKYVPIYLQRDTQLALRVEMEKGPALANDPGYIYMFETRDPQRSNLIQLKVGCIRADDLSEGVDQWEKRRGKKCRSKVQNILHRLWPGPVKDSDEGGSGQNLPRDNIKAGDPGPFCHYVERLIHIELSDLSLYEPYQHPNWKNEAFGPPSDVRSAGFARKCTAKKSCLDCGAVHREVFTFTCPPEDNFGENLIEIVGEVIEKWGGFVNEYYT